MAGLEKYHVASGSYYIAPAQPKLLQAFLGTCVGVALYDGDAGVGGLIHLLLPEPVSAGSVQRPEKYATTGMPLFLEALYQEGAAREKLKAVVAGGALVGPIDQQDLALDIGGRTAETVREILTAEGISIEGSETGGFFSCCLNLNLETGESAIMPAGADRLEDVQATVPPESVQIEDTINQILPIPQVALKILRIIEDDTYDIAEMAQEVRKDQVISARTLRLCNSSLYSRRSHIETLDDGLVLLGQYLFVQLVISAAVKSYFDQSSLGYSICKGGLFHHALGTAMIAEKLARQTETVSPSVAYTAGLLHDIGKVVLDQHMVSAFPLFYRDLQQDRQSILTVERDLLGLDHTQVGSRLAAMWSLPDSLASAIRYHHCPESGRNYPALTHIVYLADLLMAHFHTGLEIDRHDTTLLPERLANIGLSVSRFEELVDLMPQKVFACAPELALD